MLLSFVMLKAAYDLSCPERDLTGVVG